MQLSTKLLIGSIAALALMPLAASAASITEDGMALAADAGIGAGVTVNTNADVSADTNMATTASAGAGTQDQATITITSADAASGSTAVTDPSQVTTDDDFSTFAKSELRSDATISAVAASPSRVAVTYHEPAHFLGIFPASLSTTAQVNADGSVQVSHPWYAFLYGKQDAEAKAALQSQVQSNWNASASGSFSAADRAHVLALLQDAVSTNVSASANTSASASGSASGTY